MHCPLCGYEYDADALTCSAGCPMAAIQGCHLLCCPNCGYQMVDERKSGIAQLLRRLIKAPAGPRSGAGTQVPPAGGRATEAGTRTPEPEA